jgi:translation initiation factor 5
MWSMRRSHGSGDIICLSESSHPNLLIYFLSSCILIFCISLDDAIDRFRAWRGDNSDAPIDIVLEELRQIQTMASLRPASRPIIYIGASFTGDALIGNELESHVSVLKALAPKDIQQRHLIAAFEWFFGVRHPQLMRFFPVILKQLFDHDLVEEDVFLKWGGDLTRNEFSADHSMISLDTLEQLKLSAAPFLKWLEEAEEESDEEDDDEGNEEEEDG